MFLLDHSKHPQYQLKLYSVHCLADGVRIFLTIAFPFKESFKFDIVYDRNFGCLRYVGFRRQVTVLVRFGSTSQLCPISSCEGTHQCTRHSLLLS